MSEKKFVSVKPEGEGIEFIRPATLAEEGVSGEILQGTFIEAVQNRYDNAKLDYKFEKEDGKLVIVNGGGNLGYNMKFVNAGDFVQIIYLGKSEISKGPHKGKLSHTFEVNRAE
jgi:hypothetical protein